MDGHSRNVLGAVAVLALSFACATVPSDAPQEFHAAKAGIDKAKQEKVQDILPTTMNKAESEFKKAVTMWKDAKSEKSAEKSDAMKGEASTMAKEVVDMTSGATELRQNIASWDSDISVLEKQFSIPSLSLAEKGRLRGTAFEFLKKILLQGRGGKLQSTPRQYFF